MIFSTINGDSNVTSTTSWPPRASRADGRSRSSPSASARTSCAAWIPPKVKGHLAAWNYFQSIETPKNKEFVKKFKKYTRTARTASRTIPIEAAYIQVYLWKLAVEKASSTDVDKVREAVKSGIEFDAPGGKVKVDPKNQHIYKQFRMGKILEDKQFDIVYETPNWIEPDPYPPGRLPRQGLRLDQGQAERSRSQGRVSVSPPPAAGLRRQRGFPTGRCKLVFFRVTNTDRN